MCVNLLPVRASDLLLLAKYVLENDVLYETIEYG